MCKFVDLQPGVLLRTEYPESKTHNGFLCMKDPNFGYERENTFKVVSGDEFLVLEVTNKNEDPDKDVIIVKILVTTNNLNNKIPSVGWFSATQFSVRHFKHWRIIN